MTQLLIAGRDPARTAQVARDLGRRAAATAAQLAPRHRGLHVLGPVEAAMHRVAGQYRWQILIRGPSARGLNQFVNQLLFAEGPRYEQRGVKVIVDVDPLFMM
jgi:primosomal protein N' (replication factor Y)